MTDRIPGSKNLIAKPVPESLQTDLSTLLDEIEASWFPDQKETDWLLAAKKRLLEHSHLIWPLPASLRHR